MILVVLSWDSQQQKIMNSLMCCLNECLLVLVLVVLVLVLCCVGVGGSC
jgi:type IV secretory pathway TrbL component